MHEELLIIDEIGWSGGKSKFYTRLFFFIRTTL